LDNGIKKSTDDDFGHNNSGYILHRRRHTQQNPLGDEPAKTKVPPLANHVQASHQYIGKACPINSSDVTSFRSKLTSHGLKTALAWRLSQEVDRDPQGDGPTARSAEVIGSLTDTTTAK
jgi:hypothetical protein